MELLDNMIHMMGFTMVAMIIWSVLRPGHRAWKRLNGDTVALEEVAIVLIVYLICVMVFSVMSWVYISSFILPEYGDLVSAWVLYVCLLPVYIAAQAASPTIDKICDEAAFNALTRAP